jgi:hypothetical protein
MRSAILQAASISERQEAHAALVQVLAGQPDRRAWHRAAARSGASLRYRMGLRARSVGANGIQLDIAVVPSALVSTHT